MSFENKYYESPAFWEGNALLDEGNKIRIDETIQIIPNDVDTLIDVGCGNGVFISSILDIKPSIQTMGLDRSKEAIQYVKGDKTIGEITNIPFESDSFDCVTCLEVIEHLNVIDFETSLNELSRLSKKYIIIGVPFNEKIDKNQAVCPKCTTSFNIDLHLQSFDYKKLENLFTNYGFVLKQYKNVVKTQKIVGLDNFLKLKNFFIPKKIKFNSPICILCGYENHSFKLSINESNNKLADSSEKKSFIKSLKTSIKNLLPKNEVDGYWAICLYEKIK